MRPARSPVLLLYADDSAEALFGDGARLRLSPCGAEFVYESPPPAGAHPLQGPERRRQRTEFVVSGCRDRVLQLLDFRNTFSCRPFLPSSVIPPERKISLFTEISEVVWPSVEDDKGCATRLDDGRVRVSSLDGHAHLYMTALQEEFTVEFLCQLSCKAAAPVFESLSSTDGVNADPQKVLEGAGIPKAAESKVFCNQVKNRNNSRYSSYPVEAKGESLSSFTKHAFHYTWLTRRCSVSSCPEVFRYPMALALNFHVKSAAACEKNPGTETDPKTGLVLEHDKNGTVSVLPKALLLSCRANHLHRWNFCDLVSLEKQEVESTFYPLLLKIVMCGDITYRFTFGVTNSVEIHPGDGSVFISEGLYLGKYFKYSLLKEGTGQKEERIYAARDLPPDKPRTLYSVRSVITQATRFLEICYRNKLSLNYLSSTCCWETECPIDASPVLPVLLQQAVIPGVGRFAVYSDNMVLATFLDGVILHMIWSFAFFNKGEQGQFKETASLTKASAVQHDTFGWCRLRFPNGATELVQLELPGDYASYVRAAGAWCRGLDEKTRKANPLPVAEENWSVAAELQKIQRFQFLLENSNIGSCTSISKLSRPPIPAKRSMQEPVSDMNIQSVLEKTSKTIQDIDLLLSSRK